MPMRQQVFLEGKELIALDTDVVGGFGLGPAPFGGGVSLGMLGRGLLLERLGTAGDALNPAESS